MSIVAYVGIDSHEKTLAICVLEQGCQDPAARTSLANDPEEIRKVFNRLRLKYDLRCCYEASCGGYVLQRQLTAMGIACDVIAPSQTPRTPGDRVKTDKRDALKLARLHQAGLLAIVHPPTQEQEALRRVTRLREQVLREVVQTKNETNRFLGGLGLRYAGRSRWTQVHWSWLESLPLGGSDQFVLDHMLALLKFKLDRLADIDRRVAELARSEPYRSAVDKLCCLRGVGLVTAITLVAEILDFDRFPTATALMSYLGLVPKEASSGQTRRLGAITKTGNSHCRRVLVEAAWKYLGKPAVSKILKARQAGQPPEVIAHAWKAQVRLHKTFVGVSARRGRPKAVVATARELVGFVWAIMTDHMAPA